MKVHKNRRGAAMIEFVFVAALLIFLLFGIMEAGFMFSNALTVDTAAQQGARAAALTYESSADYSKRNSAIDLAVSNAGGTLRDSETAAQDDNAFPVTPDGKLAITTEQAPLGSTDWVSWDPSSGPPTGGTQSQIRVRVYYQYNYLTGGFLSSFTGSKGPKGYRILEGVSVQRYGL